MITDIVGCTIEHQPSYTIQTPNFYDPVSLSLTIPAHFEVISFVLTRSKSGRLFWRRDGRHSAITKIEALDLIKSNGWILFKRKKRKHFVSFHWFKEADLVNCN